MADELLSDAEIEVLLGKRRSASQTDATSAQQSPAQSGLPPRLADPLTRIHQHCAREFAVELSALLRRTVRVQMTEILETSPRKSDARRDASGGVWQVDVKPHLGKWQVEIVSDILLPMIDCMLGGGREPAAQIRRPLTEIETRLGERVVRIFLTALCSSWQQVTTLPLEMAPTGIAMPSATATAAVAVSFQLEMAAARGAMFLSIPLPAVALLLGHRHTSLPADAAGEAANSDAVELVASLGETQIEPGELAELAIGDIIATEQASTEPIVVSHDGIVKFEARLGASQGRKALEIERAVPAPQPSSEE